MMPILPRFPFRRIREPEFYRMTCPRCGFDQEYELAKGYTVCTDPECDRSDDPEVVDALPAACPNCGAGLRKTRIPVRIVY